MKTRLVHIGNSRGVRIPKPLIEEAGLGDDVDVTVVDHTIVVAPLKKVRAGWAEAAARARHAGEDALLDGAVPTRFDREEWKW